MCLEAEEVLLFIRLYFDEEMKMVCVSSLQPPRGVG